MTQTKRRKTKGHPGVVLIKPDEKARTGWRVRYKDPDSGRMVRRTLDLVLSTPKQRKDFAVRLSEKLAKRRIELQAGAPRATGTPIDEAIQRYYDGHAQLRPRAVATYKIATDRLLAFCRAQGIETVDDLDRGTLMRWREGVISEPKRLAVDGRRGQKAKSDERRSPHTINRELRNVGTTLRYLVDCDLFSRLSHDDVRRACKPVRAPVERKKYLRPSDLRKLLAACERHDRETFKATRRELAGNGELGATPRYPAIGPAVAFCLLSGCRRGEMLALKWSDVDLEARDHSGRTVGEVHIGSHSKTSRARVVDLGVSPALRRLLVGLRLRSGGQGSVFGLTEGEANTAMQRLVREYGAPKAAGWQTLRVTCATFLCNAVGIFGAASPFLESRQLGHSVSTAERFYLGTIRGIDPAHRDLESAMEIQAEVDALIELAQRRRAA